MYVHLAIYSFNGLSPFRTNTWNYIIVLPHKMPNFTKISKTHFAGLFQTLYHRKLHLYHHAYSVLVWVNNNIWHGIVFKGKTAPPGTILFPAYLSPYPHGSLLIDASIISNVMCIPVIFLYSLIPAYIFSFFNQKVACCIGHFICCSIYLAIYFRHPFLSIYGGMSIFSSHILSTKWKCHHLCIELPFNEYNC